MYRPSCHTTLAYIKNVNELVANPNSADITLLRRHAVDAERRRVGLLAAIWLKINGNTVPTRLEAAVPLKRSKPSTCDADTQPQPWRRPGTPKGR